MLYVDVPTRKELEALVSHRAAPCVSLYLPTTPFTQHVGAARTELRKLLKAAEAQLADAGFDDRSVAPLREAVEELVDDDEFWRLQARSLAVLVTPELLRTFRLPTALGGPTCHVADRFHLKPLLRAASVPLHAFVLALAENEVRLFESLPDAPLQAVSVPGLPRDAASAVGTANVNSRSASGRIQGSEGQKVRLRQFCRRVDAALRPVLSGRDEPLVLVAAEPLRSLYRHVNSFDGLAPRTVETSPATLSPQAMQDAVRDILDARHGDEVAALRSQWLEQRGSGRSVADLAETARAATFGAVATLLVDIDAVVPGTVDEATGAVERRPEGAGSYGIIDEIAGRVLATGGRVLGVRAEELPTPAPLAALLRHTL